MTDFVNPTIEYKSTQRFTNRVADYVAYRPRYPVQVLEMLVADAGLTPASVIADIGSGTGFSTELFLRYGCPTFGVEPNAEMRAAGEHYLAGYPNFTSVEGTAEATTLPDASVDFVTAGQALHWFNPPPTRIEFNRILKSDGKLAFFWNERDAIASPMMEEYMHLFNRHLAEVRTAQHSDVDNGRRAYLFADGACEERHIRWSRPTSLEQLIGRVLSSSYMPTRDDPRSLPMIAELTEIFERYAIDGKVDFGYETALYFGKPARGER